MLGSMNVTTGVPVSQIQKTDSGNPAVKFVAELNQHVGPVNCIRFSPNGNYVLPLCRVWLAYALPVSKFDGLCNLGMMGLLESNVLLHNHTGPIG